MGTRGSIVPQFMPNLMPTKSTMDPTNGPARTVDASCTVPGRVRCSRQSASSRTHRSGPDRQFRPRTPTPAPTAPPGWESRAALLQGRRTRLPGQDRRATIGIAGGQGRRPTTGRCTTRSSGVPPRLTRQVKEPESSDTVTFHADRRCRSWGGGGIWVRSEVGIWEPIVTG